ncbi:MAG: hypothetical protein ACPHXR_06470 [Flavicella sp.]
MSTFQKFTTLVIIIIFNLSTSAKDIYVSPGNTKAIKNVKPGDVVWFQGGRYTKPIILANLKGTSENPIVLKAMPGERVIFDGTDALDGKWQLVSQKTKAGKLIQERQWELLQGKLYSLKIKSPIYDLVYKNRLMSMARWPSARWDDPWRLDRYHILRRATEKSEKGKLHDGLPTENTLEESKKWLHYDRSGLKFRETLVGDTGLSFEDAVLVMSHTWGSWASRIVKHEIGSQFIEYDTSFTGSGSIQKEAKGFLNKRIGWDRGKGKFNKSSHGGIHFFIMGLAALDLPEEWWYDEKTKTVYFISPDGKKPSKGTVYGKRRDFAIDATNCSYLYIEGMEFRGTAARLSQCKFSKIEDTNFKFAASNKFTVGNYDIPQTTTIINKTPPHKKNISFFNTLKNCQFTYQDGNAFLGRSTGLIVDNVLIYRTQQTTLGLDSRSMSVARPALIRRVTIDDVGASVGIRGGGIASVYELNNIMHFGGLQYDGASLQMGGREKYIYRYNWSHDHPKRSYRFDAGSYPNFANAFGEMSYNVAWNTPGGFSIKGDDHLLHNNLLIGQGGFELFNMKRWASKNERTVVANNIVPKMSAGSDDWKQPVRRKNKNTGKLDTSNSYWLKETVVADTHPRFMGSQMKAFDDGNKRTRKAAPLLAQLKNNYYQAPEKVLRDPENLDFRPKKEAVIVDAGHVLTKNEVPWKTREFTGKEGIVGDIVDIGPYEYGADYYWIPGFKFKNASTPIPKNGTTTAKKDCDLMWLGAYNVEEHHLYIGYTKEDVNNATKATKVFKGKKNIYSFDKKLSSGTRIYWRVDALKGKKIVKGKIWTFTVE